MYEPCWLVLISSTIVLLTFIISHIHSFLILSFLDFSAVLIPEDHFCSSEHVFQSLCKWPDLITICYNALDNGIIDCLSKWIINLLLLHKPLVPIEWRHEARLKKNI